MTLRKIIKNRGHFPSDESATKLIYLALRNATTKWTMPLKDWKKALTQFAIIYKDRVPVPGMKIMLNHKNDTYTKFLTSPRRVNEFCEAGRLNGNLADNPAFRSLCAITSARNRTKLESLCRFFQCLCGGKLGSFGFRDVEFCLV